MLGFVPRRFPDETLYSLVSRYRAIAQGSNLSILENLFGEHARSFSVSLPSPIAELAARLPPQLGLDVDRIIDRHTALPYFTRFIRQKAVSDCRLGMSVGWQNRAARVPFVRWNIINPPRLRFCPACVEEQRKEVGQAAWLRSHQLPGVLVCPVHAEWLLESSLPNSRTRRFECPPLVAPLPLLTLGLNLQTALPIAEATRWLLDHPGRSPDAGELVERMRQVLVESGFGAAGGKIQQTRLRGCVLTRFGPEFLTSVGLGTEEGSYPWWIKETCATADRLDSPPLPFLIILATLRVTVADFFTMPLRRSALRMAPVRPRPPSPRDLERMITAKRLLISEFMANNPGATRSVIDNAVSRSVQVLRRCDNAWLEATLPPKVRTGRSLGRRVDWAKRDEKLAELARSAVEAIRADLGRPRRLCHFAVAEAIGYKMLNANRHRLPKTITVIADAVETDFQLTLRRLAWAARHFEQIGVLPSRSKFAMFATRYAKTSPEVGGEIDRLLEQLADRLANVAG